MKTLGIVISTPGRRSLARTLTSIFYQRDGVEDVFVVGDGHSQPTQELVEFYAGLGLPVRYQATVRTRDWGHTQVNYGLLNVRGDYVTYQDDDDIYFPRALPEMIRMANEFTTPMPILGRIKTPLLGVLWQRPNATSVLDGHCLVAPNDKKKLGYMNSGYNGDQCLLHTTLRNYPNWAWTDRYWTFARPDWKLTVWTQKHRDNTWIWTFSREDYSIIAQLTLRKDPESDRMFASLTREGTTRAEIVEILQFAVIAGQGNDCWFQFTDPHDTLLIGALRECNFKEHTRTEYTHDWPPDFWPPLPEFDHVPNPVTGERLEDYRDDVWGGRSVS